MSILRVANLQFNASGTRRIDYDAVADDGIINISAAAIKLPVGDTASRPNSTAGMIRYNSDTGYMEFGGATSWIPVASNAAFNVANAAFASANNVAPQVTPAFNTANAAFSFSNTVNTFAYGVAVNAAAAFAAANNGGPQIAPTYNTANAAFSFSNTVNTFAYGVAVNTAAAFAAANNVGPQIAPTYNTANAAFGKANTALQNTSGVTFAGSLYFPGGSKIGLGTTQPSGNVHIVGNDSNYQIALSGTTKGMRVETNPTGTILRGVDSTLVASYQPLTLGASYLSFETNGATEAMRITSTGNVGIGTSSPSAKLTTYFTGLYDTSTARYVDIVGDFTGTNAASATNAGAFTGIRFGYTALSGKYTMIGSVSEDSLGYARTNGLSFWTSAVDAAPVERLRITGSGNVGIGTTSPTGKLDVASRGITKGSMPSGSILQVQQTWWDGTATLAAGSFTDHPNLSVAITPTSATSKVLVMVSMQAVVYNVTMQARFTRNGTAIGTAAAAGSRVLSTFGGLQTIGDGNHQFTPWNYQYLDSPATTSALTYKVQLKMQSSATAYLNRSVNDADNSDWAQRTTSSITVMEIAQ